jgi:hypothetical protein
MVTNSPRTRRPWLVPVLAAAAVVLVLAVGLVELPDGDRQPAGGDSASLPDAFPAFSFVQGKTDGRFGRAIAFYDNGSGHEDFRFGQLILASADGDRYRQIAVPEIVDGLSPGRRLSPSGTKLAIGGNSLSVLDLMTGTRKQYLADTGRFFAPMAISPDERFLAYTMGPSWGDTGTLSILELATGKTTGFGNDGVLEAAFSPDSTEIAFQTGYPLAAELVIGRLDGTVARRINPGPRSTLGGANAWSPDGKWLAVVSRAPDREVGDTTYSGDPSYVLLNAAGTAEQAPAPIPATGIVPNAWGDAVLGWRSPTSMLVSGCDVDGTTSNLIVEVNISTGSHELVSRFRVGQRDDLAVGDVQLASGLLDGISIRHSGDPDRGVWPTWAIVSTVVCLTPLALLAASWFYRRRRRLLTSGPKAS